MNCRLQYRTAAQRDFTGVADWLVKQQGKARTRRYLDEIETQIQRIAENPMLGPAAGLPHAGLRAIHRPIIGHSPRRTLQLAPLAMSK